MNGWSTQVGDTFVEPKGVIGIVVAQGFPEPELIRTRIIEGVSRVHPDTVWVMRDKPRAKHAVMVAYETFEQMGLEPILSPLVPYWKSKGHTFIGPLPEPVLDENDEPVEPTRPVFGSYDMRAQMRDAEMRQTCERIIVFHDASSGVTSGWVKYKEGGTDYCPAKVYVVERGKKKRAARKGRKPQH